MAEGMSPAQKRYALARAAYEVAQQTEREIIAELSTPDMSEDDDVSLYMAASEAVGSHEAMTELFAAEEAMVAWAREVIRKKHDKHPQYAIVHKMLASDWRRFVGIREKVVDLTFRLVV